MLAQGNTIDTGIKDAVGLATDIKGLCEAAAQRALERAATTRRRPTIGMPELLGVLGESSPSVDPATVSRYEEYAKHRRRA